MKTVSFAKLAACVLINTPLRPLHALTSLKDWKSYCQPLGSGALQKPKPQQMLECWHCTLDAICEADTALDKALSSLKASLHRQLASRLNALQAQLAKVKRVRAAVFKNEKAIDQWVVALHAELSCLRPLVWGTEVQNFDRS